MAGGRPTEYKPEFCQMLIDHMIEGYSFESFAAVVDSSRATIYRWREDQIEFRDAFDQAREKCRLFWEKSGIAGMNKGKDFNQAVWAKNISCRFREEWTDQSKSDVNTTSEIKIVIDSDDAKA